MIGVIEFHAKLQKMSEQTNLNLTKTKHRFSNVFS